MRIAFRADGSRTQGTGHVMRCLTLAEAARTAGHEPRLFVNDTGVDWLERHIVESGVAVTRVPAGELAIGPFEEWGAARLVIDSYDYADSAIDDVALRVKTMVLVDFGTREAEVEWYLDTNLGAEPRHPSDATWLTGSRYSLVRSAILAERDPDGATINEDEPSVLVFLGGSDPLGLTVDVVHTVLGAIPTATVIAVGGPDVSDKLDGEPRVHVERPGDSLPVLMGAADIIVCAAGTSSWDVCTIGKPAVFLGIVDNQVAGIGQIRRADLGPAIEGTALSPEQFQSAIADAVREIVTDSARRRERADRMRELFDGDGAARVVSALTS